jgi:hypothetical protein
MQQSAAISSPCDTMSHPCKSLRTPVLSGLQPHHAKKNALDRDQTAQGVIFIDEHESN